MADEILQNEINIPHENRLSLLPVCPGRFFVLWDFSNMRRESFSNGELANEIEIALLDMQNNTQIFSGKFKWYQFGVYIEHEPLPGTFYAVMYAFSGEEKERITQSNNVLSPTVSGSVDERAYASLEFHKKKVGA